MIKITIFSLFLTHTQLQQTTRFSHAHCGANLLSLFKFFSWLNAKDTHTLLIFFNLLTHAHNRVKKLNFVCEYYLI